jgi:hypothetical protein
MRIRPALFPLLLTPIVLAPLAAQAEPIDDAAVAILRRHGLEQSQVMEHLSWICDVHGPRLTGSPNLRRAQQWAVDQLAQWGLTNAHLEEWGPFGRGWQLEHSWMAVEGNNPWPVLAWPKAWTPSVDGRVSAEVVAVGELSADALDALDLHGKIVLVEAPREVKEPFEADAKRHDAESLLALADSRRGGGERAGGPRGDFRSGFQRRAQVLEKVFAKEPLAILDRAGKGDYGTVFVQGASSGGGRRARLQDPDAPPTIPQFTLAVEHYNRICRLLQKGIPVRLAFELRTRFFDDLMERNVVAEIPGTDAAIGDQVVMIGAHFDSWHAGTGATDNGAGSAVMLEAMRLLTVLTRETGRGPRRTIRIGLWSGEEQGLLGSRAYVQQHFAESAGRGEPFTPKPAHAKLSGYFNLDNGTGRIRGVYLQGNEAVGPIFRAWLRPFHDLDATTITLDNTGGTDHQAFDGVGLPGFQFIQDPVAYSPRTHHSNMDVWDHAIGDDLEQAATIIASFAWHTAQRDEMLPRKPVGAPAEAGARRGR